MRTAVVAQVALAGVIFGSAAAAQVTWRPAPSPVRSAAQAEWYLSRDPILIAGEWYYPVGATRFFNPRAMVQVGTYGGVPLYADTTLEPHSIVYVPIGRGLMQPYERPRTGQLAGTVGSRTPSFPVQRAFEVPVPVQYWDYFWLPDFDVPAPHRRPGAADEVEEPRPAADAPRAAGVMQSAYVPEAASGVWLAYADARWTSAGRAVPLDADAFVLTGEYQGYPVFRARHDPSTDVVYLPSREGFVAPYRRVEARP